MSVKSPFDCKKQELESFEGLVREGQEVAAAGLSERIRKAAFLMFLTDTNGLLIGVSALKRPSTGYRAKVFQSAQSKLQPDAFGLELGWIFVVSAERGKKLSHVLVEQLISHAGAEKIYATTREGNLPMMCTNEHCGFRRDGIAYPSDNGNYHLLLYVR